jgi:hypothetical protein
MDIKKKENLLWYLGWLDDCITFSAYKIIKYESFIKNIIMECFVHKE